MDAVLTTQQLVEFPVGVALEPEEIDVSNVVPVLVPGSFFDLGTWPGPHNRLKTSDFGLTWALLLPNQKVRYVNFEIKRYWEEQHIDWKALAMRNLARYSENGQGLRQVLRTDGSVAAIAFRFEDGLGPSRLLFRKTLKQSFPEGYRVAIPERNCGLAFSKTLRGSDWESIRCLIDTCYHNATLPMMPGTYDEDDLLAVE